MRRNDEFVSVVICTHGIPTDEEGNTGDIATKEFIDSLCEYDLQDLSMNSKTMLL
jgi:hypothetical protein